MKLQIRKPARHKSAHACAPRRSRTMLDGFLEDPFFNPVLRSFGSSYSPSVNISESDKNYVLEVVAPGYSKEDFKLSIEDSTLTVSAEVEGEKGDEYTRKEYWKGSFEKRFELPAHTEPEKVKAGYNNGILSIEIPKNVEAEQKSKREIKVA